jgi:SPP1 gp7 family putative phage head morphogenesis protein
MMDARTSAAEAVADEVRAHAVDLLRFDAHLRNRALKLLREVERELVKRLTESEIGDGLTAAARVRLQSLLANTRATIGTAYGELYTTTSNLLEGLAAVETTFASAAVNGALQVELLTTALAPAQLRAIVSDAMIEGAPLKEWFERLGGDTAQRFADEVRKGMVAGETNAEIVRRVRGTKANAYKDGVMEIPRNSAQRVVRTAVQTVANTAQVETYKANADVIQSLVHVSTLDSRTSDICVARDGLEFTLDGAPVGHKVPFLNGPPYHWNCRSVMTPRLKSWRAMGIDLPEIPAGTRASTDGQLPASMSFDDWLKSKGEDFQDKLLGKGKAALWRDGKITRAELLDMSGRPLSLEELRAKVRA